ncbi:hypothetical protein HDV01_007024 [Terramyces sp. JEL0728]|nr:hypothetical protein HDV01_007024 [Terramyces sp. JEL0728]
MLGNLIVGVKDSVDDDQDVFADREADATIKKETDIDMEQEIDNLELQIDQVFLCDWDGCGIHLEDLKQLVLHVNNHVDSLPWSDGGDNKCRWKKCWNTHSFQNKLRMTVDISKDEEVEYQDPEEEEEYKRRKRKPVKRSEKQRENDIQKELKVFQDYQRQLEKYSDVFEYCQSETLASKTRLEILSEYCDDRYKLELEELAGELEQTESFVNETRDMIANQVIPMLSD